MSEDTMEWLDDNHQLRDENEVLCTENARLRKAMESAYAYINDHRHGKAKAVLFDGLELYKKPSEGGPGA